MFQFQPCFILNKSIPYLENCKDIGFLLEGINSCLPTRIIYEGHKITVTSKIFHRRRTTYTYLNQLQSFKFLLFTKIKASILHTCQNIFDLQNPHVALTQVTEPMMPQGCFSFFLMSKKQYD